MIMYSGMELRQYNIRNVLNSVCRLSNLIHDIRSYLQLGTVE